MCLKDLHFLTKKRDTLAMKIEHKKVILYQLKKTLLWQRKFSETTAAKTKQ